MEIEISPIIALYSQIRRTQPSKSYSWMNFYKKVKRENERLYGTVQVVEHLIALRVFGVMNKSI